jgi:ABC-type branched-subunit amino acid transport system ATPase component
MITVLDAGSLIAEGNVDAVRNDPAVVEAYLGA